MYLSPVQAIFNKARILQGPDKNKVRLVQGEKQFSIELVILSCETYAYYCLGS